MKNHQLSLLGQRLLYGYWAISVFLILSLVPTPSKGQTYTEIHGTVLSEENEPLVGVTVEVMGSSKTTSTNDLGQFTFTNITHGTKLKFGYIGYTPLEWLVTEATTIHITLQPSSDDLEEVVVVGYGTQKKVNLSGAVDYVDSKVLASRPISNVAQGLQGVAPNLNIRFNSGAPGEAPAINIRGLTSINGGDPLILVDNVPVTSAELIRLAPQDMESFSIIKDASAAAIYGARAAFGVILVTTKTGAGGVKVNYSNNFTMNTPTVIPNKVIDPYVFSRLLETSTDNTPWDNVNYSDQFYKYAKERSDDPSIAGVRINPSNSNEWEYMGNRDWTRHFLSDWNSTHTHDLSISGSTDKVQYYLSGSFNRQNSPIKLADDYFDRYNLRSKVNYKLADFISVGNNTVIGNIKRVTPSQVDLFDVYNVFPTSYDINPDGTWANSTAGQISAKMIDGGQDLSKRLDLQSTFNTEFRFFENRFRVNADYTFQRNSLNRNWYTTQYQIGYGPNDIRTEGNNMAYKNTGFSYYNIYNIYGTYQQSFNLHQVNAVLGFNQEDYRYESTEIQRAGLISEAFPTVELATGAMSMKERVDKYALRGVFYRLNYTFDDKYIVEFNGRYDGSSRFPKDKRFGFFPSGSVAWRLDRENFLSDIHDINLLKVRASYGELGNQAVANNGYLAMMPINQSGFLIGGERPTYVDAPPLVSPNYTWEKVNTLNFGLDFALWNNKISTSFDYYSRQTLRMLTLGKELPKILGASEPMENAADMKTKGWEFTLAYQNSFDVASSPLNFSAKALLADSYSEITRFDNPRNSITQYYKGMRMGEIWGLENDGLFRDTDEIAKLDQSAIIPWGALSIVPGWPKYVDQDGDGKIEKGYILGDTKDLKIIGNSTPRYQFGLDLAADWKGFDVRLFFQGIGKRDYYPIDYLYWGTFQQPYGNFYGHLYDFYRPTNDSDIDRAKHSQAYLDLGLADQNLDSKYPVLQAWLADRNLGQRIDEAQGLAIPQTSYLLNAAYIRLKNITVGYSLPKQLLSKAKISNLRIYVSAENVAEWSAVKNYFDPETINANIYTNPNESAGRKGNGMTYPFLRSFSGGIQLTF